MDKITQERISEILKQARELRWFNRGNLNRVKHEKETKEEKK